MHFGYIHPFYFGSARVRKPRFQAFVKRFERSRFRATRCITRFGIAGQTSAINHTRNT